MIEAFVSMVNYLSARKDDDIADRMNYLYTPNILLAFSVLISFKQFGGRPLECLFPSRFPGTWEEVPFFLLFQAFCFRVPTFVWKGISLSSGVRVQDIVEKTVDASRSIDDGFDKYLRVLSSHIARVLRFQHKIVERNRFLYQILRTLNITYSACFISYMYLMMKLLYIGNILVQIYMLNKFLGTDSEQWYGFNVLGSILNALVSWECVLVINILNEKIFLLMWFWYGIMLIFTVASFFYWAFALLIPYFGRRYICRTLLLYERSNDDRFGEIKDFELQVNVAKERKDVDNFVNECLKQDGIFLLRMVGLHAGTVFNSSLVMQLFATYRNLQKISLVSETTFDSYESERRDVKKECLFSRPNKRSNTKEQQTTLKDSDDATTILMPLSPKSEKRKESPTLSERSTKSIKDADDDDESMKRKML